MRTRPFDPLPPRSGGASEAPSRIIGVQPDSVSCARGCTHSTRLAIRVPSPIFDEVDE